jgi:beta-glucosidase
MARAYEGIDLSGLPAGFVWGAATAAFQIEGDAEHRGDSIWDAFCREPGRVVDGSDGRVACDHVGRVSEDVALLRDLGVDAYRFSIAWPRVQPAGSGRLEAGGLAFYDRLVDLLLDAGIQPWATLYHWDLPLPLHEAGGWPARDTAERFAEYATAVHAALGDRVRHWMTLNEPWCSAWLGYGSGRHAPGVADHAQAARAAHHLLLGHGRAVRAMREQAPADHQLGIVLNLSGFGPAPSLGPEDAARVEAAVAPLDGVQNRLWLDAVLEGRYPQDVLDLLSPALPEVVQDGDLAEIAAPLDFLGVNYYNDQQLVPADRSGEQPGSGGTGEHPGDEGLVSHPEGDDVTAMGWPVTPDGFRRMLVRIGTEHPAAPPLVVTENGSAYDEDPADPLDDPRRVDYLLRHVRALTEAVRDGADVRGYFAWSLMDNFEWAMGYTKRFGLARVDYDTLERRPRRSFETYRAIAAAQRAATP